MIPRSNNRKRKSPHYTEENQQLRKLKKTRSSSTSTSDQVKIVMSTSKPHSDFLKPTLKSYTPVSQLDTEPLTLTMEFEKITKLGYISERSNEESIKDAQKIYESLKKEREAKNIETESEKPIRQPKKVKIAGSKKKSASGPVIDKNALIYTMQRKEASKELVQHMKHKKELVYIDETTFQGFRPPTHAWVRIGEPVPVYSGRMDKGKDYTVVAAATKDKFLGFQIFEGHNTWSEFGCFMLSLLTAYPEIIQQRDKHILVLNNNPAHRATQLKDLYGCVNIFFNAPYSPLLNPVAQLLNLWKQQYFNVRNVNDKNRVESIAKSVPKLDFVKLGSFFMHSLQYIIRCLNEEDV